MLMKTRITNSRRGSSRSSISVSLLMVRRGVISKHFWTGYWAGYTRFKIGKGFLCSSHFTTRQTVRLRIANRIFMDRGQCRLSPSPDIRATLFRTTICTPTIPIRRMSTVKSSLALWGLIRTLSVVCILQLCRALLSQISRCTVSLCNTLLVKVFKMCMGATIKITRCWRRIEGPKSLRVAR